MARRADHADPLAAYAGLDDRELTLAFQRGERAEVYQTIYQRYGPRVTNVCRRMLGDPDDVQEASQEAFLRVYQSLDSFNGRYELGAWITRIATNVCLDHLRARSRKPSHATPWEVLDLEAARGNGHDDPQDLHLRRTESRRVRRILASLPPMHRAAIVLRDFEGLSYPDAAVALGITQAQVKALLHRARGKFKRSWNGSGVAALLPWRWAPRLKETDPPGKEQATQVMAQGSQVAASCTGILQTCSQVVGERVAPALAALLVGTTAGAAMSRPAEAPPHEITSERAVTAPAAPTEPSPVRARESGGGSKGGATPSGSGGSTAPSASSPQPSPTPSATPTPSPSPTPTPPPSPPEPRGLSFAFSTDVPADEVCTCMEPTKVESERVGITERGLDYYQQGVRGTASAAGRDAYAVHLKHASGYNDHHSVGLVLYTAGGSFYYDVSGKLAERSRTEWGGWTYRYRGTYRSGTRPNFRERVPERGTYVADVTFSVRHGRVVAAVFSMTEAP